MNIYINVLNYDFFETNKLSSCEVLVFYLRAAREKIIKCDIHVNGSIKIITWLNRKKEQSS